MVSGEDAESHSLTFSHKEDQTEISAESLEELFSELGHRDSLSNLTLELDRKRDYCTVILEGGIATLIIRSNDLTWAYGKAAQIEAILRKAKRWHLTILVRSELVVLVGLGVFCSSIPLTSTTVGSDAKGYVVLGLVGAALAIFGLVYFRLRQLLKIRTVSFSVTGGSVDPIAVGGIAISLLSLFAAIAQIYVGATVS